MKKVVFFSSWRSRYLSYLPSFGAAESCTEPGAKNSGRSSSTGIKRSKRSAPRPSFYLAAACLALGVSGFLLTSQAPKSSPHPELLERGWQTVDFVPCPGLEPNDFFELEGDGTSIEGLFVDAGTWLISRPLGASENTSCHKIKFPAFIEEVQ